MEWMALDTGASMFDITVSMEESEEGLTGFFEYNTDLFDSATIERMAQHLENLIESALRQPDQAIAKLPFLTEIEKQLFFEWNQTKKEVELAPFHHLFAQKAAQLPDQVALDFKGRTLTYRELDERANQLAHYLIESGVGKGTFVAISMERSLEMIIAALGVMKSGGAYIPLDPTYPSDRLGYMLEDSKAPVLLTQRHLAKKIPSGGARMICIDEEWEAICQRSKEDPAVPVTAEDLAYMIYTSGSTGQPKGVLVTHRGIGNVMREQRHLFGADETSRVLQFASFSFDASVFDFCMAFGAGATLYLAEKDDLLPGPGLIRFLRDNRISHATLSPSVLNAMPDADLPDLQVIVTAGEACSAEIVNRWAPGRRFFNAYGPTEATIWASTKQCRPGEGKPTIGFAVANVELHVLDQYRQPVPLGVPGELYIGGVGLARGYHGRPDLTEERFIPHPEKRGERLYKTGDLVRFLPNGDIDFLGRVDDQVKIRGFRIELGEIENLLAQHPDVKTCAVIAREDRPGVKRLVAYVVAQEPGKEITAELRAELKQKVPDFMVPAFFIQLEKMPMTANGKIDRKALPVPDESQLERVEVTEARNDTEAKLSEIWSDVLGVTPIGIHDNFFDLGGDSILGIQVVTRAKEAGIAITTKQLFEHQTIAELAKEAGSAETVVAEQGRVTGEALLTPIQRWFFEQELEDPHHWNQSVILKVNRPLQERHLAGAIQAVLNHHDALRFRYEKKEEGWKQIHADEVPIPLVRVDMPESEDSVEAIREQVERHQSQFDLGQAPLIRFIWLQFGEGRPSRLAIIAHHLVIDGVSWRILMEDLIRAYTALENGQPVQLPPKTTSYKQWGELLSRAAGTDAFKDEAEFWMGQVGQPVELLPREIDGDNRVASSRTITRILSEDETSALLHEVPAAYRTQMNDMLLSALALTLAEWTERDRFLIDLESHGRQDVVDGADLTRTIGWFTAKYPIVLKKDQESLGHLIKSVKEQLRAIPNQGFGYGVLKHLRKDELSNRLGDLPNAEIAFNYLGQFDSHASGTHWFEQTDEPAGQTRSGRGRRTHLLEIDSMVTGGRLRIDWTYSDDIHHRETMEKLSERYVYWLKELIAHCLSDKAGGFTPSDFKEFGWSQTDLDQITAALVRTLGGKPHDPETD